MAADETNERPRSLSVYDYSDKSIPQAAIAVLAYAGLHALRAVIGGLQQPGMAVWFAIDFAINALLLGALAFGVYRKSRIAVVLAILYIVGAQFYVWFAIRSASGTIVSVIVTGFLLGGANRIFQFHREQRDSAAVESGTA